MGREGGEWGGREAGAAAGDDDVDDVTTVSEKGSETLRERHERTVKFKFGIISLTGFRRCSDR